MPNRQKNECTWSGHRRCHLTPNNVCYVIPSRRNYVLGYLTSRGWWCIEQPRKIDEDLTTPPLLEAATLDDDLLLSLVSQEDEAHRQRYPL